MPSPPEVADVVVEEPGPEDSSNFREDAGGEESFESAMPAAARPADGGESVDEDASVNRPSLDEMLGRVPPQTKDALEQLFRLKYIGVRKIKSEELR